MYKAKTERIGPLHELALAPVAGENRRYCIFSLNVRYTVTPEYFIGCFGTRPTLKKPVFTV